MNVHKKTFAVAASSVMNAYGELSCNICGMVKTMKTTIVFPFECFAIYGNK